MSPRTLDDLVLAAASWPIPEDWWPHFAGYDPQRAEWGLRFACAGYEVWLLPGWFESDTWFVRVRPVPVGPWAGTYLSTDALPGLLGRVAEFYAGLTGPACEEEA